MDNISNIDLLFVVLTGKVSLVVNRALAKSFKVQGMDITPEQFVIMAHLWKSDGVTQQDLSVKTNKDKPSITRLIDSLEKLNLVSRVADRTDRRINLIYLTQPGRELEQPASNAAVVVIKQLLTGVTDKQLEICRMVLNTILNNIA